MLFYKIVIIMVIEGRILAIQYIYSNGYSKTILIIIIIKFVKLTVQFLKLTSTQINSKNLEIVTLISHL